MGIRGVRCFVGDVIWITGLPGSGKPVLASQLRSWSKDELSEP